MLLSNLAEIFQLKKSSFSKLKSKIKIKSITANSKLIKKKGIMFVATLNKNLKSYIFGIVGAEYILRWLPIGTHDWEKFLTPQNLKNIVCDNNFLADETVGVTFNLLSNKWSVSNDTSVNYISTFLKN